MDFIASAALLEGESGGSGGGVFWEIPNFFAGVSQAFTDSINALYSLIPNPDPFPAIIDNLDTSGNADIVGFVTFWLDTAYDIEFIQEMFGYWAEMMVVSVGIMVVWKIINLIRG